LEANGKRDTRNGSVWSDLTKPGFDDQYLHEEILTLLPRLERFARALTHDVVSADDLVQDCLTRALEKIHMWQPGIDLRAWLFTILYRQYISHARRAASSQDDVCHRGSGSTKNPNLSGLAHDQSQPSYPRIRLQRFAGPYLSGWYRGRSSTVLARGLRGFFDQAP
jgi:hypothetical protein